MGLDLVDLPSINSHGQAQGLTEHRKTSRLDKHLILSKML